MGHHPWLLIQTWSRRFKRCTPNDPTSSPATNDWPAVSIDFKSVVGAKWDAFGHEHFFDRAFTDDLIELIFHHSPQRFKPWFLRSDPQLLRIRLGYDGA